MNELTEAMVKTVRAAAKKMTGANRRSFEAQAALDYFEWRFTVGVMLGRMGYRLQRSEELPKWSATIEPMPGGTWYFGISENVNSLKANR